MNEVACIVCAFAMWVQVPGLKGDEHFQFSKAPLTLEQCMTDATFWGYRLTAEGFSEDDVHMDCIEWHGREVPSEMATPKHGHH